MTTANEKPAVNKIDLNEIIEIVTPFDEVKDYESLLAEIQGNIIKSHGRNHAVYLFLKFKKNEEDEEEANKDIEKTKQWIGSFSHKYVTSALEQAKQGKRYRQNQEVPGKDVPAKVFANFFLTRAGYMHLGYTYDQLPTEDAFRQGMQDVNMQQELGDDSSQWDAEFQEEIHALVLLAADKGVGSRSDELKKLEQEEKNRLHEVPILLQEKLEVLKKELGYITDVIHEQNGYVLRDRNLEEIEHFGFRDGVSQPLFLKRDIDKEREHNNFDQWDPRAPLSLVLFKDPLGDTEKQSYGSFLVFRKLEQNVGGWNRDVVRLARKLYPELPKLVVTENGTEVNFITDENGQKVTRDWNGKRLEEPLKNKKPLDKESLPETLQEWMVRLKLTPDQCKNVALAEAYTMGRFRDGEPTVLSNQPGSNPKHPKNNFNYENDLQGSKCPFFSHARKVNPRGDTGTASIVATPVALEEEKMHRIVRRAINYGHLPSEVPEKDAGLLFMCFQASLTSQFNFMQKAWAKEQNFVKRDVGTDVVIGVEKRDDNGRSLTETYKFPKAWESQATTEADFKHWVTMRGGEFFFAPSMSFLKALAPKPRRNRETRDDVVFRGVPIQEIEAGKKIIMELLDYQRQNWAIGLHGDTRQPDQFLTFFNQRELPFKFYLLNQFQLGNSNAYKENIKTLAEYLEDAINQEIEASEYKIVELKEYQRLGWDIGVFCRNEAWETDTLVNFFGERELPFEFYVRSEETVPARSDAYTKNIETLETYIASVKGYITTAIFHFSTIISVRLVSKLDNMVLSLVKADRNDRTNVVVYSKEENDQKQLWQLKAAEKDEAGKTTYYYVVNQHSGKVLHVTSGDKPNWRVVQFAQQGNDNDNQKWRLESAKDGSYYLVAKHSGNVLYVTGTGEGTDVIEHTKDLSDNQKWNIEFT
ncbi:RICIN domain-containing protein [Microcoleus sp. OTE_8_concoct_300]|uniref:RICIN domain-containing protein n=1 Tax=Microcoleus sp. OTE_8_concoct_300 TaxID=2964710 RepID=UPI00403FBFC4